MIKFFRNIRKQLLSENKFSKYLIYAFGEIILVVIGILIALQINNWNENRKLQKTEKEFILSVKNDLEQDKAFIKLVVDILEPKIEAYHNLDSNLISLYNDDRESLNSLFKIYFNSQRTFYPISGSYESAVSENQLTVFRNKNLIRKLVKLYNSTYDRLNDNSKILDDRWDFLSKKYSYERRTGHFREMNTDQLSEFLDDLYHHFVQMKWYQEQLKSTTTEIDEITADIQNIGY